MEGTREELTAKMHEAMRAVTTFNAAGIAGAIGLMQRTGPVPLSMRLAGLAFLVGIFSGVFAWINRGPYGSDERYEEIEVRRMAIGIYLSLICFLAGTTTAFFSV